MEQPQNVTTEQFGKVVTELLEISLNETKSREAQVVRLAIDLVDARKKIELIERFLGEDYTRFKEAQPKDE